MTRNWKALQQFQVRNIKLHLVHRVCKQPVAIYAKNTGLELICESASPDCFGSPSYICFMGPGGLGS